MKKFYILLLFIAVQFISCDSTTAPVTEHNAKNLVAFTAVFDEKYENGRNFEKLVIADFNDPSSYKILTDTNIIASKPYFSRDKSKIIFGDISKLDHDPQFVLYEYLTNQMELLEIPSTHSPISGRNVVWNYNETGFYFSNSPPPFTIQEDVLYYSLAEKSIIRVHFGKGYSVYPVALLSIDTLIIFSNNTEETQQPVGYYLMDSNGNYIDKINNTHLDYINRNGIIKKGALNIEYSASSNLFVFAEIDSNVEGYKIAVTDFSGNYYKEYTAGNFIDDHPKWGPDGKTILFDRREIFDQSFTGFKIMKINIESGAITEFVSPNIISGAVSLRYPEF